LLAALWAASLVPLIGVGTSSARLVEALATDEAMQLNLLRGAAANHTFSLTFGPYGHFVFNLILIVLRFTPGELSDPRIVQTGRSISVLFAAATVWLTFIWTRRAFGEAAAWIALGLLFINATLYTWSVALKPDLAQIFFLMLALAFASRLAEEPRLRWLALASVSAGVAFACKYSGLFVLPIIFAVVVWRPVAGARPAVRAAVLRGVVAVVAVALFAGTVFLNVEWIASHLTEDGRIDARVSAQRLAQLALAVRVLALALAALVAAPWLWSALRRRQQVLAVLWSWLMAATVFAVTFVVVSPYSLRRAAFVKGLFVEASDAAAATPFTAAWLATWLQGIAIAVEWPVLIAALATMAVVGWMAARRRLVVDPAEPILVAWLLLYALVLAAPVHEFYVQYALPLAPPAAMLAGRGAVAVARWLSGVLDRLSATAVLVVAVLGISIPMGADLIAARAQLQNRERTSAAVTLGRWLECRVPASARIAYDYFSYVPPPFHDVWPTWGGSRAWLSGLNPDIVIVNGGTAGAVIGNPIHAEYYQCLIDGVCGYERVISRGDVTIYARSGEAAELSTRAPAAGIQGCDADDTLR
jgi:4-amino-4-deoxy-L-arabinose transferase-like glycosyltransferase